MKICSYLKFTVFNGFFYRKLIIFTYTYSFIILHIQIYLFVNNNIQKEIAVQDQLLQVKMSIYFRIVFQNILLYYNLIIFNYYNGGNYYCKKVFIIHYIT